MVEFIQLKIDEITKSVGSNKLVLDVGCGSGSPTKAIALMNRVVGLDIDVKALKECQKISPNIPLVCGVAEKLPFKDKTFDMICAIELIEHLEKPKVFLKEAKRILKNNGTLLLTCPNIASFRSRLMFLLFGSFPDYRNPEHIQHFTGYTLRKLLEENGFKVINIWSVGLPAPYKILARKWGAFFFSELPKIFEKLGLGYLGAGIIVIAKNERNSFDEMIFTPHVHNL